MVVARIDRPDLLAGFGVDGFQAAVKHADVDLAVPHRDAAVDRVTAGLAGPRAVRLRVVLPDLFAIACIQRIDHRKRPGGVHHAVDNDGRGLHAAVEVELVAPGQAQLADVAVVDLFQRAVALFVVSAPVAHPVTRFVVGSDDALAIDIGGHVGSPGRGYQHTEQQGGQKGFQRHACGGEPRGDVRSQANLCHGGLPILIRYRRQRAPVSGIEQPPCQRLKIGQTPAFMGPV
ncbi:hypothetical protein D3C85_1044920 [compost metagenome]